MVNKFRTETSVTAKDVIYFIFRILIGANPSVFLLFWFFEENV